MIRPGRVDIKVISLLFEDTKVQFRILLFLFQQEIGHCSRYQIEELYLNFYPDASRNVASQFTDLLLKSKFSNQLSAAKLQGMFMLHKDNEDLTEATINDYFNDQ